MSQSNLRHITLPAGFVAGAAACGIKTTGEPDVAVLAAERNASAAVVLTRNQIVGAPITRTRRILPRGYGKLRAFVVNSGCSNVCTGEAGLRDADAMGALAADRLGADADDVLVASTGVIGQRLPMDKVRRGIAEATRALGTRSDGEVVQGIMTTDTRRKSAVVQATIDRRNVTVAGIAKGAGMVAPSMATMIAAITTDVAITPAALHKALKAAVAGSFNAITIDSDTSTSDTVAVLASGVAGNRPLTARSPQFKRFAATLGEVCGELARAIVADGEGATKLIRIEVTGARNDADARLAAKSVADSPLLKCAVHGGDPNWGRIVMALGKSSAKVDAASLRVRIGGVCVFSKAMPRKFDLEKVESHMAGDEVAIACDLGLGKGAFTALTCDLSREYVTINADYHT